ncbi:prepilin-type N-terminal cleavage/methylation domain-containing protein [Amphibacillus marinus]|uniref:Prepilin-type N-terminal cleavage/methylation domain-containing protein n=1 Tax=Amphibacillus marinus TaxID=872970 RepID=A0A1H8TTD2_9BACI|nr:prepilin-type N-terminal cleavage/methylation domain-containing protein [Amphibacillus marinus]SEO93884.1 prepilin-type N-terminal cleavage/methylation domain-containing protein [Amphibacillus marinus]
MVLRYVKNEQGLTLVEVLASITILSIIVVTFLAFFIQSARTTKVSEDVMDATYLAQSYMEKIYYQSTQDDASFSELQVFIDGLEDSVNDYRIITSLTAVEEQAELYTLYVEVFDNLNRKQAQMETKLIIEESGEGSD